MPDRLTIPDELAIFALRARTCDSRQLAQLARRTRQRIQEVPVAPWLGILLRPDVALSLYRVKREAIARLRAIERLPPARGR